MRKALWLVPALLFALAACGGSSNQSSPDITSVKDLPSATSPMEASASTSLARAGKSVFKAAQTGQNFNDIDGATNPWGPDMSRGSCEVFNFVKEGLSGAGQADMVLCYVKKMDELNKFAQTQTSEPLDIYDGDWHVLNLNLTSEDEGVPERIRMKIERVVPGDPNSNIKTFTMFMCNRVNGELIQSEYVNQSITGQTFVMNAIGHWMNEGNEGWHSVDVDGSLNSLNEFVQKVITTTNTWGNEVQNGSKFGELTQTPGAFMYSGYQYGAYPDGNFYNHGYARGELLGDTLSMLDLAMGDGAVRFNGFGTHSGQKHGNGEFGGETYGTGIPTPEVESWNGDTLMAEDNAFVALVEGEGVPNVEAISLDSFPDDMSWNCEPAEGEEVVDLAPTDDTEIAPACQVYTYSHGEWVNCFQEIEQPQQQ